MASISVSFKKGAPDPITGAGCYFISAEATSSEGMPRNIFCLQVSSNATNGARVATFSHIANQADIAIYPEDCGTSSAFFRVSAIKLILPSAIALERVEQNIKSDIQFLVNSINASEESDSSEYTEVTTFS